MKKRRGFLQKRYEKWSQIIGLAELKIAFVNNQSVTSISDASVIINDAKIIENK